MEVFRYPGFGGYDRDVVSQKTAERDRFKWIPVEAPVTL
jgi:hypothetical protein